MLSIGKLVAGQQQYYVEQVAKGRDDYYSGRGEAPGRWSGRLAAELGLQGQVSAEAFTQVLQHHRHPQTGEELRVPSKIVAYDFTFSAPKSVSVLYAIAPAEISAAIVDAHDEAVTAAMDYLEREVACARRGRGGHERMEVRGLVSGRYRHRMSRAGDVQLHDHCVTANLTCGRDGKWGALDAYPAHQMAKAVGCLYQAHLRWAIREHFPQLEWGPVKNGCAEIAGVPDEVLAEFSTRRRQILGWVADHGATDAGLRNANAVMATREAKSDELDMPTFYETMRIRAAEHGMGGREVAALFGRELDAAQLAVTDDREAQAAYLAGGPDALEAHLTAMLAGPQGLTKTQNTFGPRDTLKAVAGAARQGAPVGELVAMSERVMASEGMLFIDRDDAHERCYTAVDLREQEAVIVHGAERRRGEHVGEVDPALRGRVLEAWPVALNADQRAAIEQVTSSGHGLEHIEALAGTGKTTLLGAVAEVYRRQGYRVAGVAKTGRAVRELKERAGVPDSRTGQALLYQFDRYGEGFGAAPTVLLLDEASMAETREASRILAQAERDGVKVIAVGDSGQLTSVDAGGWLGALSRRFEDAPRLTEVMRQRDQPERNALEGVHEAKPKRYVALKQTRGELHVHADAAQAEQAAVEAWHAAQGEVAAGEAVMVARDNARRERLNHAAREQLKAEGRLPAQGPVIGGREFAVGDRVIARRNDRLLDVDNGMRGTVVTLCEDAGVVTIEADAGGRRELPRDYVEAHLEHAYALTGHGTQGGTLERVVVVGAPEEFSQQWGYTALSRARDTTEVHLVGARRDLAGRGDVAPGEDRDRSPSEAVAALEAALRRSEVEDLAIDQLEAAEARRAAEAAPAKAAVPQEAAAEHLERAAAEAVAENMGRSARNAPGRDGVRVPDPLAAQRRALGPERADRLPTPGTQGRAWLLERSDRELAELQEQHASALQRLDTAAAHEARRLERDAALAEAGVAEAQAHVDDLQARRGAIGFHRRAERRAIDERLAVQHRKMARLARELEQIDRDVEALRAAGRHPDQWIEQNGQAAVTWAEAAREQAIRRELAVREAEARAVVEQPRHVREALGDRPEPGSDRERWDELARALERHRVEHDIDVGRHGALGPEPAQRADHPGQDTAGYDVQRRELAARIGALRADRALDTAFAAGLEPPAPDTGLGL